MRALISILLLPWVAACQPALYLPPPAAGPTAGAGTRVLQRTLDLTYAVLLQAGTPQLTAESIERVQVQVADANSPQFARWSPQDMASTRVLDAAARLTRMDGSVAEVHPAAGSMLELPMLAAGDRVDVFMRRSHALPQALPPWVMAMSVPVDDLQVRVQAPPGLTLRLVRGSSNQHADVPGEGGIWQVREMHLPALPSGAQAAPARHDGPWLVAVPVGYRSPSGDVDMRWADSWDSVARYVQSLLAPTMQLDAAAVAELRPNARLVLQRVSPVATAVLLPGLPRAFAGLAAATALEAAAVVAASQPPGQVAVALVAPPEGAVLLPDVPGLYAFETALWAEPHDSGWVFTDPVCARCRPGDVGYNAAGGQALVLRGPGQAQLAPVPLENNPSNQRRYQFTWDLTVEGQLIGSGVAEFQGASARPLRAALLAPDTARQLLFSSAGAAVNVELVESAESAEENEAGAHGTDDGYVVQLTLRGKAEAKPQGYELTPAAIAGDGFPWDISDKSESPGSVLLPGPITLEVSSTLQTPGGLVGKRAPKPVLLESPFGKYEARFIQKQSMVVYTRRLNLTARVVPADQRAQLAAFAAQIRAVESAPLLLRTEE